ncbi:MAG: DUF4145 domain-containing protein [Anaerovoracaceae bacterium]
MDKEERVLSCRYCGNTTLMKQVREYKSEWDEENGYYGYFHYFMMNCPVCNRVTLFQKYWSVANEDEEEILYPTTSVNYTGVPPLIKNAFDAAVQTKGIDQAICALSLRRVLEMICKEKAAKGKTLFDQIDNLISEKILPEMMKDVLDVIRIFGNEAAHGDEVFFSLYDVEQLIDYVATVINYLYSLPARVKRQKERFK